MRAEELELSHVTNIARPALLEYLHRLRHTVRLLMVVDVEIDVTPGASAFGIERVIRLLRESTIGCLRFRVDVAQRSSAPFSVVAAPTGTDPKYLGFRFNSSLPEGSSVLSHYDEVWCFGFKPDNLGASDANISQSSALPASDAELAVLTTWMNDTQGGVFATGDHDYLGASMCHRIPRVGTMRAWTNAQGVPPINSRRSASATTTRSEKGDSPAKRFAMISVYDGPRAAVGRVATDSTWHHWMNINITDLETAGGPTWQKIRRYYLNLAVWLAPARIARDCCHFHLTCPPPEAFATAVLGGMVRAAAQVVRSDGGIEASALRVQKLDRDEFDKRLLEESARGVNELADAYQRSLKRTTALFG
jgi:hypothetical protein